MSTSSINEARATQLQACIPSIQLEDEFVKYPDQAGGKAQRLPVLSIHEPQLIAEPNSGHVLQVFVKVTDGGLLKRPLQMTLLVTAFRVRSFSRERERERERERDR